MKEPNLRLYRLMSLIGALMGAWTLNYTLQNHGAGDIANAVLGLIFPIGLVTLNHIADLKG
jgi:hypothetical protein